MLIIDMIESLVPSFCAFGSELDDVATEAAPESALAVATDMAGGFFPLDIGFELDVMVVSQVTFEVFFLPEDCGTRAAG